MQIYAQQGQVHVQGAQGESVYIFDAQGRQIFHTACASAVEAIPLPSAGVYAVKVGNAKVQKVIAIQ